MKRVILYSQPGCPPCFAAKAFLQSRNVPFEYKDVQADPAALDELLELNSRSTPTLVVGDEVMIGFDPDRLTGLLEGLARQADAASPATRSDFSPI